MVCLKQCLKASIFQLVNIKKEAWKIVKLYELSVAGKRNSQNDISNNYSSVIRTDLKPRQIMDKKGKFLEYHSGINNCTIGKRQGLGIIKIIHPAEELFKSVCRMRSETIYFRRMLSRQFGF
jgi:tRNA U34 2-thiouridine synthase MnmA/TrmU